MTSEEQLQRLEAISGPPNPLWKRVMKQKREPNCPWCSGERWTISLHYCPVEGGPNHDEWRALQDEG